MPEKRLLLLSNSTMPGEEYLKWPEPLMRDLLGEPGKAVFFVPFAVVRITWDEYAAMVAERFRALGHDLVAAHRVADPVSAAKSADALVVGGGNTFHLLLHLHRTGLMDVIKERAEAGVPFIGWSAGANVAGPTVKTTNDMPIVEPPSLAAMGLVPFQINPHFSEGRIAGLGGEDRVDRLMEFIAVNPGVTVVGLPEGTALLVEGVSVRLVGDKPAKLFRQGEEPWEAPPGALLDAHLK